MLFIFVVYTDLKLTLQSSSRPKSLADVTAQDHTITVLQRTLQSSNVSLPRLHPLLLSQYTY